MTEALYCYPCNMTFCVEAPLKRAAEHFTCECGRRFWHAKGNGELTVKIGVWPENAGTSLEAIAKAKSVVA